MATDDPLGVHDRRRVLLIPVDTVHNHTRPTNRRVYDDGEGEEEEGQQSSQPTGLPNPLEHGAENLRRARDRFQAEGGLLGRLNRRQNIRQEDDTTAGNEANGAEDDEDNENGQAPRTLGGDPTSTTKQRRCVPCRNAKKGCDGGSPCGLCAAKGFQCVEHIPKNPGGRCQACKKAQRKCDRQRPCGRCQAHGVGYEGCVPIG